MASLFRKALRLFVILDEPEEKAAPTSGSAVFKPSAPASSSKAQPTLSAADLDKYERHFEQLFEQANLPGPDYFEFWRTLEALEEHIPDEAARMKAAFASLQVQGLDKAKLLSTAAQYREVVLQDKASFETVLQRKASAEIAERQGEWENLRQQNESRQRQIAQLQQEMAAAAERMEQLQREIEQEKVKLTQVQQGYLTACEAMVAKINADIERIQQIL